MGCTFGAPAPLRTVPVTPDREKTIESGVLGTIHYTWMKICGEKNEMNDEILSCSFEWNKKNINLFAIFNGFQTAQISKYIADNFVNRLKSYEYIPKDRINEGIAYTCVQFNAELKVFHEPFREGSSFLGSTLVIALLTDSEIYIAHLGNCKAVLATKDTIIYQTQNHASTRQSEMRRLLFSREGFSNPETLDMKFSKTVGYFQSSDFPRRSLNANPQINLFRRNFYGLAMLGSGYFCQGMNIQKTMNKIFLDKSERNNKKMDKIAEKLMNERVVTRETSQLGRKCMSLILLEFQSQNQ